VKAGIYNACNQLMTRLLNRNLTTNTVVNAVDAVRRATDIMLAGKE
jgi:S-adenosylhomocysteine hydrolase